MNVGVNDKSLELEDDYDPLEHRNVEKPNSYVQYSWYLFSLQSTETLRDLQRALNLFNTHRHTTIIKI